MAMPEPIDSNPADCNCLAVRQAARHMTQLYDRHFAAIGLRSTQYSILARLDRRGPLSINALAAQMVMDRTTLGRNILPLQRDGLLQAQASPADRRSKELHLTQAGRDCLRRARKQWAKAQDDFETAFGAQQSAALRGMLRAVVATDLGAAA
jgi:DNA-binding MarR family transcriptional regulator